MNKNRINIDGTWYVKEDPKPKNNTLIVKEDCTDYIACIFEDNKWCFEASILIDEEGKISKPNMCSIEIKSKNSDYTDFIDNNYWMISFIDDGGLANDLKMNGQELKLLREFLIIIKGKGWLD